MLCQASTATVFSSCLFLGHFPFSFVFSKWNACSIGFRSGDWLGHCITVHFFPFKNSLVAFAVCFGSLSICTVKRRPMSSEAFGWIWADNIARNTSEFILLLLSVVTSSINTREPVPLAAIHAHATTTMLHWWGGMLRIMSSSLPSQFWNNILWTDETKINLYQSDRKRRVWRRKGTAHDPKHTTSLVKHGGGSVGMYGCQWNWFSCIYWWCDYWQKQQDEFWSVSGNIICSYSAKCFRTHWTALHSADGQWPKAYCKSNQRVFEGKEVDCYAMAKSITWPESDWACISLAEDKTEGKMPQEQAGTEDGCSRGLAEHHQGWNPASGDVYAFQTSGCNWLQRICNQILKSESLIYDYYSVPLLLVP